MRSSIFYFFLVLLLLTALTALARPKFIYVDYCLGVRNQCTQMVGQDGSRADVEACVNTIKNGGTVDGVNPNVADLKSCQATAATPTPKNTDSDSTQ